MGTVHQLPLRAPLPLVGTPAIVVLDARLALIEEELDRADQAFHSAPTAAIQEAWHAEIVRLKTEWQELNRQRLKLTGAELVLVNGGKRG